MSEVVGYSADANGYSHSFADIGGVFTTLADPFGADATYASGVNNKGQVAGFYFDASGNEHGFLATPIPAAAPEPSQVAGLGLGVLGLAGLALKARKRQPAA